MEEIEVPTEHVQEEIHHHATHSTEKWIMGVALSSAIIAALAAVTALLAGHHSDEAMITQILASDQWGYYQAKGIKASVLNTKIQILKSLGKPAENGDLEKIEQYQNDQDGIGEKAREKESESRFHLQKHMVLARGVTLFSGGHSRFCYFCSNSKKAFLDCQFRVWLYRALFSPAGNLVKNREHFNCGFLNVGPSRRNGWRTI